LRIRFFNTFEPVTSFYRDLLPSLAKRGNYIEVVSSKAEYRNVREDFDKFLKDFEITSVRIPSGFNTMYGRFEKICIMITYMAGATIRSMFGPKVNLNFFLTQPPLFFVLGFFLKIFRRQRYCCLLMDIYPDLAIQAGVFKKTALTTRFLIKISRFALKRADKIIVIGDCMKDYIEAQGISSQRIHMITNWTDEKKIIPVPHSSNRLRQELGIENDLIILYSGNMGISHFFDDILEVAQRLREVSDLKFVFLGNGVRRKEIELAKEKYSLCNLLLLPFQPVERLSESLSMGDLHFISLRTGFDGLVVPSKAYSALAVGRPIIYQGQAQGEIGRMVKKYSVGAVVPPVNPYELEKRVLEYYKNRTLLTEQGSSARSLALRQFSREQSVQKYIHLLKTQFSVE